VKDKWLMIPCRAAHRLISEGMDRQLGPIERLRLRLHLGACAACVRVDQQLGFIRQAVRRLGDE
jgi:hypothetical protein